MPRLNKTLGAAGLAALAAGLLPTLAGAQTSKTTDVRTGEAAYGDWRSDAPGVWRKLDLSTLPAPFATASARNTSVVADQPAGAAPKTLPGFTAKPFLTGLEGPRQLRRAPNGDIFVAETSAGRIRVLRTAPGADKPAQNSVFAENLEGPFGIAFYPAAHPKWVYVAQTNSVVRFPYADGQLKANGAPQTVVAQLATTTGGHTTRDIAFSQDGKRMFVSVGSGSNVAEHMDKKTPAEAQAYDAEHGFAATWGSEANRADVLEFTPEGGPAKVYAAGIRNCVGLMAAPGTDQLWCAVNERDALGDNLVPDYVTRVKQGGFYGWPWYYMGDHEDPRLKGERPDLAGKVTNPDVPLQAHSAALQLVFYPKGQTGPAAFPAAYDGDVFVTLHGSWNRAPRTGYKIVRLKLKDGAPTGAYEDFVTGFVIDDQKVWARPVGITVAADGALLFSDDGNGTIWRVAYTGKGR
jgi:glucose/arabinose dehydrogenase